MSYKDAKFHINVHKAKRGSWGFGICLFGWYEELYIYISIFRWSIIIGKVYESFLLDKLEEVK